MYFFLQKNSNFKLNKLRTICANKYKKNIKVIDVKKNGVKKGDKC
jgi:hypothetical protein